MRNIAARALDRQEIRRVMEDATAEILKRYDLKRPWDINNGTCGDWADLVAEKIPGVLVCTTPERDWNAGWLGHYWIKIKGKDGLYYDSENLDGVRHWRQLKIFAEAHRKRKTAGTPKNLKRGGPYEV